MGDDVSVERVPDPPEATAVPLRFAHLGDVVYYSVVSEDDVVLAQLEAGLGGE